MSIEELLAKNPVLKQYVESRNATSRNGESHATCSEFCVDHYVDPEVTACRPSSVKRDSTGITAHWLCREFCADYYIGTAQKPCRTTKL